MFFPASRAFWKKIPCETRFYSCEPSTEEIEYSRKKDREAFYKMPGGLIKGFDVCLLCGESRLFRKRHGKTKEGKMKVEQMEMPKDMYKYKCPYSMTPTRLVIHNTANDAPAYNEIHYMQSNTNEVSFHFAVDDERAIQGIPLDRNAWHAGDGGSGVGNRQGIAIEICYSWSGGKRFEKAVRNAAALSYSLLCKYGWGVDRVTKHQDYSKKYCPHRILDDYGFDAFKDLVSAQGITNVYKAIERLSRLKVIDGGYWKNHYGDIKYLDTLFINASKAVIKKGKRTSSALTGISAMTDAGVITVPEYWKNNYWRVKWLPELLAKLGGSV